MPTLDERYDEAIQMQESGDLDGAVKALEAIVQESPDYALAHAALSRFYSIQERHDEAVEAARVVCKLEPDDDFSFVSMSLICQKAGRMMEAEAALMEARRVQFGSGEA